MPADMRRYPPNWTEIRAAILERAGHRCERCGVANYAYRIDGVVYRYAEQIDGAWHGWNLQTEGGEWMDDPAKLPRRPSRVVLTIAHIHDPDPQNCDPANLQALCQACHNQLDAPMRAKHAATTRRRKAVAATGQKEMEL
jgi:5-methylcytosine-specific restriction endonuclease McrA